MHKVTNGPTAYFDVDSTLLEWDLPEGVDINDDELVYVRCRGHSERLLPNEHNIKLLRQFAKRGIAIIVWSAGGSDWAEAAVQALDLEEFVSVVTSKPHYYIDDLENPREFMGKHIFININGEKNGKN